MIPVLISQAKGLALYDDGEQFFVLNIREPNAPLPIAPYPAAQLIRDMTDLESISVGDPHALLTHLRIREHREKLLHAAVLLIDGERTNRVREQAAKTLVDLADGHEWTWVESVLMSAPLPASADPAGASAFSKPHEAFFDELVEIQSRVEILQTAWRALPNTLFTTESRDQCRFRMVQSGAYRHLIRGTLEASNPFATAMQWYSTALRVKTTSAPTRDLFFTNHRTASEDDGELERIWDVAPWRSSWFAHEWMRVESRFAQTAANRWCGTLRPRELRAASSAHAFQTACSDWTATLQEPAIADSLRLMRELADETADLAVCAYEAGPAARLIGGEGTAALAVHQYDTRGEELTTMIGAFFDAHHVLGGDRRATIEWLKGDSVKWALAGQCAQRGISRRVPFDPERLLASSRDTSLKTSVSMPQWTERLLQIFSIYALDLLFRQNGCVVVPSEGTSTSVSESASTALVNLGQRRLSVFDGFLGSVLRALSERLKTDTLSGLARAQSGWLSLDELVSNSRCSTTEAKEAVATIERKTIEHGFAANTFQRHASKYRLNPDLSASTQ